MSTLRTVFAALDARLELGPRWRGGEVDRLVDATHSALVDAAAAYVGPRGWQPVPEVTYSVFGERGSIDLLALRQADSIVAMMEIKTSITSTEELLRRTDAKARLLPGIVLERFGWRPATVASILVVEDSTTNRRRLRSIGPLLAARFPGSTVDTKRWLRSPATGTPGVWFLATMHERDARSQMGGRERVHRPVEGLDPAGEPPRA